MYDFGAGLGAATRALKDLHDWKSINMIERSNSACEQLKNSPALKTANVLREKDFTKKLPEKSLVVFSYSLTELSELPKWAQQASAFMILEPSTQSDGRKLLELRKKLVQEGFSIWAPCLHQESCPLLSESKRDWCHDRFHFEQPTWFEEIEKALPIKNKTLTTSYLIAHKNPAPQRQSNAARITGDQLVEKGKNRQLICRGPQREFLAWMHKNISPQEIPRGEIIEIPKDIQKISNELRVDQKLNLLKVRRE